MAGKYALYCNYRFVCCNICPEYPVHHTFQLRTELTEPLESEGISDFGSDGSYEVVVLLQSVPHLNHKTTLLLHLVPYLVFSLGEAGTDILVIDCYSTSRYRIKTQYGCKKDIFSIDLYT